ncbi:PilZ domain-containing protein [Tamilnaduibacter salinus]|uniref:PilZ domain-containing protein n=1 Tax=Tamilnaduibacter salinus TaxID=1484056 RepID=A0A2A2I1C9_9GAMM|nr:PilZ domain-containing protein [Tamilnaduibacter salinus]PAV24900.1 pilus assembly protein PilZ [Tamilnaduibacter salinus]PVY78225.1 PilZ domain-containing protein [Tamilnaduibacter salinus]
MNEPDYRFGEQPETETEQRHEFRLSGRARVWLQVEAPGPEESGDGRWLACDGHDFSANGLRVCSTEPLSVGALIVGVVQLARPGGRADYTLMFETIWSQDDGDGRHRSGLRVLESDDTSLADWLDAVADAMDD